MFNLQEAVATYQGLKARKVPVSMAWQSWGHSGEMNGNPDAVPGELDLTGTHIEDTYLGLVTKPVHIELPGIVHLVVAGHRLQLVLASTDAAYKNADSVQSVTVTANPAAPATLRIPAYSTSG